MTIAVGLLLRNQSLLKLPFEQILIPVDSQSLVRADAHFHPLNKGCFIIVHGLEGSSSSGYVLGLAAKALSLGFSVVRLNLRNCGNTLHLTPTLYNAGQSADLLKVISWLSQCRGQQNQYLVGYSLGGNLVLKTLAEMGEDFPVVKGACVVSPSIDLAASVKRIGKGVNKIYEYLFLQSLRKKIKLKTKLFPKLYDTRPLSGVDSLFAFDDLYTAPHAGYINAADYYQAASSGPMLNKIKTPTLIIAAQDDPIVPFDSFNNIANPYLHLLGPAHGGHVGFLADLGSDRFWADEQILAFCQQEFQRNQPTVYA